MIPSEQNLELGLLFAQQDILNQVVKKWDEFMNLHKEKPANLENLKEALSLIISEINSKQRIIDFQIQQIQNDIRTRLN